jgi:hypothetical protein
MARYIVRQQRAQLTTQLNKTKELIGFADRKLQ